jgi:hypothetical protein
MHFRKGGDDAAPIHQITGSLAYGAVARVTYGVVKDKNDPERRLFLSLGNSFAKSNIGFAYRIREVRVDRQITATAIDWEDRQQGQGRFPGCLAVVAEVKSIARRTAKRTGYPVGILWEIKG